MPAKILYPDPDQVRDAVSTIINLTGSPVTFSYVAGQELCPTCGGTDPFCPTCQGKQYVATVATYTQTATVRWKVLDRKQYRPEGQWFYGDCLLTFIANDNISNAVSRATDVLVQGKHCTVIDTKTSGIDNCRLYVHLNQIDTNATGVG